jgi:hypothetical protein
LNADTAHACWPTVVEANISVALAPGSPLGRWQTGIISGMLGARGSRLEPEDFAKYVSASEFSPAAVRIVFTALSVCVWIYVSLFIVYINGWWPGIAYGSWPIIAYVNYKFLNAERLLWLISEMLGELGRISYKSALSLHDEDYTGTGERIELGDFIRVPQKQSKPEPRGLRDYYHQDFYHQVIARMSPTGTRRIKIGVLGRENPYIVNPDDEIFWREVRLGGSKGRAAKPADLEAAHAVADLMRAFSDEDYVQENRLVGLLAERHGHSYSAVRRAVRIARTGRLISRKRGPGYLIEFLKVYAPRALGGGHSCCKIRLTELGLAWASTESHGTWTDSTTAKLDGMTIMGDLFYNSGTVGSMGHGNTISNIDMGQTAVSISDLDADLLARQLAELRTELRMRATGPDQDLAIANIASAQLAAEKGDAREAMRNLTHLGKNTKVVAWIIDTATAIGVPLVITALRAAFHLPPAS